jgi:hypothetical protein
MGPTEAFFLSASISDDTTLESFMVTPEAIEISKGSQQQNQRYQNLKISLHPI